VLLFEGEPNIARIIVFKLEREGHVVRQEERLAPEAAVEFAPDLVLLDADLEGDALDAVVRLRESCAVVVLTDGRDERTRSRSLELGAAAAVPKPFKPTVLARLVRELTGG
jgi:DNA-binding response OmpR family regulator